MITIEEIIELAERFIKNELSKKSVEEIIISKIDPQYSVPTIEMLQESGGFWDALNPLVTFGLFAYCYHQFKDYPPAAAIEIIATKLTPILFNNTVFKFYHYLSAVDYNKSIEALKAIIEQDTILINRQNCKIDELFNRLKSNDKTQN